jgi:hypothetical protein
MRQCLTAALTTENGVAQFDTPAACTSVILGSIVDDTLNLAQELDA